MTCSRSFSSKSKIGRSTKSLPTSTELYATRPWKGVSKGKMASDFR